MRFILFLVLFAIVGFAGWITGSLYPAPPSVLAPISQFMTDAPASDEAADPDASEAPAEDVEAPTELVAIPEPPAISPGDPDEQYRAWITEARAKHPYADSEDKMYAVMMCESGGNPTIVNPAGPYVGLFQYVANTWNGDWNDYRDAGMTDARAQIFATAQAWSQGMQNQWGCYSRAH
ncbi:MAG: transglycosylase SLT domain-containing protein [Pseudomonadota bacterium]